MILYLRELSRVICPLIFTAKNSKFEVNYYLCKYSLIFVDYEKIDCRMRDGI